eukprot:8394-Amphidinium_carterae.1
MFVRDGIELQKCCAPGSTTPAPLMYGQLCATSNVHVTVSKLQALRASPSWDGCGLFLGVLDVRGR